MNKIVLFAIILILLTSALWCFRFTYKTAYACIYKIDNYTNKTYYSCGGSDWELIKHHLTAEDYLDE